MKDIEIKDIIQAAQLESPYKNIEYFVQQKHKIAGRIQGSGNTTNIGSIKCSTINDFVEGKSSFTTKEEFDKYWRNY